MICYWCGKGKGRRYTKDKNGKVHYYVCQNCVGFFIEEQNKHLENLVKGMSQNRVKMIEELIKNMMLQAIKEGKPLPTLDIRNPESNLVIEGERMPSEEVKQALENLKKRGVLITQQ